MSSSDLLRELIREVTVQLNDEMQVEYGSESHINELDSLINDLQFLKKSLRKGPNRHKHRKEMHRLQDAIGAIRFLKNSARRSGIKSGLLEEGGLKLPPEKREMLAKLNPSVVSTAVRIYENLLNEWNVYLSALGENPIIPMRPVGSVSYYEQDLSQGGDISYGDIDYLVAFPSKSEGAEIERRKSEREIQKKYQGLFVNFLNESRPESVDIEETLRGSTPFMVMLRLPDGKLVQVDTVITFSRYTGWMEGRYTPERGIKGYTIGNLYKALGDHLVMSIGTEGVIVRSKMGERVPSRFSRSKGVETQNISTDIGVFLRDIAKYIIGSEEINEDPILTSNPGVDPENVTIAGLARGIKGLALTLGDYGAYNENVMLSSILKNYKAGLQKNIENKKRRGLDDKSYQKLLDINDRVLEIVNKEFYS